MRVGRMVDEPYVDVRETSEDVTLTAEVNDARPQDVRVMAYEDRIELVVVGNGFERFRCSYKTPQIKPGAVSIRFNNNILEVRARRSGAQEAGKLG